MAGEKMTASDGRKAYHATIKELLAMPEIRAKYDAIYKQKYEALSSSRVVSQDMTSENQA